MLPILYEDNTVFVVSKPAGMPCNRQKNGRLSVADMMAERFPDLAHVGSAQDVGLVHRLDNDTSGCLLVARTPEAFALLRRQFGIDTIIYKGYQALVIGHPPATGSCDIPIVHDPRSARRMRCARPFESGQAPTSAGQAAHTEWTILRTYPPSPIAPVGYALVQMRITTGVRHQIRVHMAAIGHPLVGDALYQSRTLKNCDRLRLPHHLLHAHHIEFFSPAAQRRVTCEAPLPPDFTRTLKTLWKDGR